MAKQFALGKKEKLKSRKMIDEVFSTGKSLIAAPVRASYKLLPAGEEESGMQIAVSASKRNFKKAADRNRVKRLLREAYRLQKKELLSLMHEKKLKGYLFFIYTGKSLPSFQVVYEAMAKALSGLQKRIQSANENPS